ncbi:hypothetical protein Acr_28g0000410 [Actinidia rufa]|uniref:Uncharacterized protein n=1 Tax=Actinidia rufa TaxID=165716 RepID=A0A7J0H8D0_9ERIC|nr:hypothetical protein Acr_28g0000410 [Actinidia rufa]
MYLLSLHIEHTTAVSRLTRFKAPSMEYWEPRKRTSAEKTRSGRTKRLRSPPPTKTTTIHRSPTNRLRKPRNSFTSFRFSPSSTSSSSTSPLTTHLPQFGGFHRLSRPIDSIEIDNLEPFLDMMFWRFRASGTYWRSEDRDRNIGFTGKSAVHRSHFPVMCYYACAFLSTPFPAFHVLSSQLEDSVAPRGAVGVCQLESTHYFLERIGGGLATTDPEGGPQIGCLYKLKELLHKFKADMASRPIVQQQNRGISLSLS